MSVKKGNELVGVSDTATIAEKDTVFYRINGQIAKPAAGQNITLTLEAEMP